MRLLKDIYHSFPVQLFLLYFKKYQVLLVFWYILFSIIGGSFMRSFGAYALFLAPEYLGKVTPIGTAITGAAMGVFIMSWNVTTFILYSRHFQFLATTGKPFLKYCINNFILPLTMLIFYFVCALRFDQTKELFSAGEVLALAAGFLLGFFAIVLVSFIYFFSADKTIIRRMTPLITNPQLFKAQFRQRPQILRQSRFMKVRWYLDKPFTVRKVRDVSHYSPEFIERVFGRHHFSAIISIFIAFLFLVGLGFFMDKPLFQLPAAASTLIFFAILLSLSGAFSYFLQSWSFVFLIGLFLLLNVLYRYDVIDPTNKAYGMNYGNPGDRPAYDRASLLSQCAPEAVTADSLNMIAILNRWKSRQGTPRPMLYLINCSGGGSRAALFTLQVLQRLDSLSDRRLMRQTALVTGASGGILGASYFRELDRLRATGKPGLDLQDPQYDEAIARDLLNPLFSSFVARDLTSPAQKFSVGKYQYLKDRGYAFEQKLDRNTQGLLNRQLRDIEPDERAAQVPLMFFDPVITRDGRMLVISTQRVRFLMRPVYDSTRISPMDPDAVDYQSFFEKQDPMNLRLLTALRMNATFPYVLPNVWLPTKPVIDVMDAGFRDNFGSQIAVRFAHCFRDWVRANTSGVVLIEIRDRRTGGWENPYESTDVTELLTKPFLLFQNNWHKMQEYGQSDLVSVFSDAMGDSLYRMRFEYVPKPGNEGAALNFHLTRQEKLDIAGAIGSSANDSAFRSFRALQRR